MRKWHRVAPPEAPPTTNDIKLYYRGFYHDKYKLDEAALRNIIMDNVTSVAPDGKIKLVIYYKNSKTSSMIMKNRPSPARPDPLKRSNVIYQFICPANGCRSNYIGMTSMRLSKRISCHAQEGAIYNHISKQHGMNPSRALILPHFKIIDDAPDVRRLRILEALHIGKEKPPMNTTQETFLLPSATRRTSRVTPPPTNHDRAQAVALPTEGLPVDAGRDASTVTDDVSSNARTETPALSDNITPYGDNTSSDYHRVCTRQLRSRTIVLRDSGLRQEPGGQWQISCLSPAANYKSAAWAQRPMTNRLPLSSSPIGYIRRRIHPTHQSASGWLEDGWGSVETSQMTPACPDPAKDSSKDLPLPPNDDDPFTATLTTGPK